MVALWTSDAVHEVEKLDAPAPPVVADHLACVDLQGSEQRRRSRRWRSLCTDRPPPAGYANWTAPLRLHLPDLTYFSPKVAKRSDGWPWSLCDSGGLKR